MFKQKDIKMDFNTIYKFGTKELNWDYDKDSDDIIIGQRGERNLYGMFKHPDDAFLFQFGQEQDFLYEVIMGNRKQKPYFDIDIEDDIENVRRYDKMIDNFVCHLSEELNEMETEVDILVFQSHQKNKISYHIVIDGIYLESNDHNRTFCNKMMTEELKEYHDTLYSTLQQFRIYKNRKYKKRNTKILSPLSTCLIPKKLDRMDKERLIYTKSLITATNDCQLYPIDVVGKIRNLETKTVPLNYLSNMAYVMFLGKYRTGAFEIQVCRTSRDTTFIEMRSREPYYCKCCKREHDHENPYLQITPRKVVYFSCRRSAKRDRIGVVGKL